MIYYLLCSPNSDPRWKVSSLSPSMASHFCHSGSTSWEILPQNLLLLTILLQVVLPTCMPVCLPCLLVYLTGCLFTCLSACLFTCKEHTSATSSCNRHPAAHKTKGHSIRYKGPYFPTNAQNGFLLFS